MRFCMRRLSCKAAGVPVGYIDLQMPLMMCKPRHVLFAHPFKHPTRSIAWDCWDQHAIRRHLNSIVRIARMVVSPDFRGLGVTRPIIRAAKEFATDRWHIRGSRPIFMEISAEMLTARGFCFVLWFPIHRLHGRQHRPSRT